MPQITPTPPCDRCFGINENRCYWCGKTCRHYKKIDPGLVSEMKFLYRMWQYCRDFNMAGTGSQTVTESIVILFGSFKDPIKRPNFYVKYD